MAVDIFTINQERPELDTEKAPTMMRKPHGVILCGGVEVANTAQCCHCGAHFVMIKGSGKKRGYCMRCCRTTCGASGCRACVPYHQRIDLLDKGLPLPQ